jgi:hypothetical protein
MISASDAAIFGATTSIQVIGYMLCRNFFNVKGRAWLLSLGTSTVYTVMTPYTIFQFVKNVYEGGGGIVVLYRNETFVDRVLVIWFLSFLCLDCVIGVVDYRQHLRLDTTWVHHGAFILNNAFMLACKRSSLFIMMTPIEVPTFILAVGSVFPAMRNDFLFGTTFFAFRLVYETALCIYSLTLPDLPRAYILGVFLTTTAMHLFWFYKWSRLYIASTEKSTEIV